MAVRADPRPSCTVDSGKSHGGRIHPNPVFRTRLAGRPGPGTPRCRAISAKPVETEDCGQEMGHRPRRLAARCRHRQPCMPLRSQFQCIGAGSGIDHACGQSWPGAPQKPGFDLSDLLVNIIYLIGGEVGLTQANPVQSPTPGFPEDGVLRVPSGRLAVGVDRVERISNQQSRGLGPERRRRQHGSVTPAMERRNVPPGRRLAGLSYARG